MKVSKEYDMRILEALYNGNHISDSERIRAFMLLHVLKKELDSRI